MDAFRGAWKRYGSAAARTVDRHASGHAWSSCAAYPHTRGRCRSQLWHAASIVSPVLPLRADWMRRIRGNGWPTPPAERDADGVVHLRPGKRARVHLGCGDVYLRGYLNVDFPPSEATASGTSRADLESDVASVACPRQTLREVRSHHLFEHFERAHALALLLRWYSWLEPGGYLTVETPDFEACVEGFAERDSSEQTVILRHIFGSQEAPWALHQDGWSPRRFQEVLSALGYRSVLTRRTWSDPGKRLLPNVIAKAQRPLSDGPNREDQIRTGLTILRQSMNGEAASEQQLLGRWQRRFNELLDAHLEYDAGRARVP